MSSNLAEFRRRMEARKAAIPGRVAERHRMVAEFAQRTAEDLSPVVTGDFQRAWETVTGDPGGMLGKIRSGDEATAGEEIDTPAPFSLTHLINRDPAGPMIEHGGSKQAPQGVLGVTAMRTREFVRKL